MIFLHPALLAAGLAAVGLPVLIHLLTRRRRRPTPWAAMRFLQIALRKQRKRLLLERWLLLACRCLLVALLGLALARPLFGAALADQGPVQLAILIDNSLTSDAAPTGLTTDLDRSKAAARAELDRLNPARGDTALLVALAAPAQLLVTPTADLDALRRRLDALAPADSRADLSGGFARLQTALAAVDDAPRGRLRIAALSAWRAGSVALDQPLAALPALAPALAPARAELLASPPAADDPPSLWLASAEAAQAVAVAPASDPSGQRAELRLALRHAGPARDRPEAVTLRTLAAPAAALTSPAASAPGLPASAPGPAASRRGVTDSAELTLPPRTAALDRVHTVALSALPAAPAGADAPDRRQPEAVLCRIEPRPGADALDRDNTALALVDRRDRLRVAVVRGQPDAAAPAAAGAALAPELWLAAALAPSEGLAAAVEVALLDAAAIDAARLATFDALVIPGPDAVPDAAWARIAAAAGAGLGVVIAPSPRDGAQTWPDAAFPALGLPWELAREPLAPGSPRLDADAARADADARGLLARLAGEFPDLLPPVGVTRLLPLTRLAPTDRVPLALLSGEPLLAVAPAGLVASSAAAEPGSIALLTAAVDPTWTDLPARPLFVPLIQELLRGVVGRPAAFVQILAGDTPALPTAAVELIPADLPEGFRPAAPQGSPDTDVQPPARRIRLTPAAPADITPGAPATPAGPEPIRHAGLFRAQDAQGRTVAWLLVRPDPAASRLSPTPAPALAAWLAAAAQPSIPVGWTSPPAGNQPGTAPTNDPAATPPAGSASTADARAPRPADPANPLGPGLSLALLIAAAAIALVETAVGRIVSHASSGPAATPSARRASGAPA